MDIEDLHYEASGRIGVNTLREQVAADVDPELELEITEVTAIRVAPDHRA
jgi:hypothetical protein